MGTDVLNKFLYCFEIDAAIEMTGNRTDSEKVNG